MFSESDDDEQYTVHEVSSKQDVAPQLEVVAQQAQQPSNEPKATSKIGDGREAVAIATSPQAKYYRLGTEQRHAFDEHMRRLREEAQRAERERDFRQQHPFHPRLETAITPSSSAALASNDSSAAATAPAKHLEKPQGEELQRPYDRSNAAGTMKTSAGNPKGGRDDCRVTAVKSTPQPVFDRLAAQAVQLELRRRHREEQQRRAEAAALRDAFQPAINHRAPVYTDSLRHLEDVPVEERLLHYGETVARERQRRQEAKAMEERAALDAAQAAVIGNGGGGANGNRSGSAQQLTAEERRRLQEDFQKRSERFLAAKAQHRERAAQDAAVEFSFQPHISATSAALDEARRRELVQARKAELQELLDRSAAAGASLTVNSQSSALGREASRRSDALYELAVARQRQQSRTRSQHQPRGPSCARDTSQKLSTSNNSKIEPQGSVRGGADEEALHRPQTNPTSDKWIASGPHRHFFEQDFVHRQELYEKVKEEEAELRAAASASGASPSPAGKVCVCGGSSNNNNNNNNAPANTSTESPRKVNTKELNERLYYSARKASEVAQRRRAASLNARECPFRPELSPGTRYVLRRMQHTRDGDIVKRLTGAQPSITSPRTGKQSDNVYNNNNSKRIDIDPEREELYEAEPTAAARRSRSDTARSNSQSGSVADNGKSPEHGTTPSLSPPPRQRVVLTRDQVEHFYQRQMNFLQERQDLIQERKEGEAVQELVECTFRPRTNADQRAGSSSSTAAAGGGAQGQEPAPSLNHVTGVSGFLERQMMARRRKAEHDELVRTMGLPRSRATAMGVSMVTGTTLLNPFTLQTAQRRRRSSCAPADEEAAEEGVASPTWVKGLTSSERVLYDALAESAHYPASMSAAGQSAVPATAPLFPLPGYTHSETSEDAIYFDELEGYNAEAAAEEAQYSEGMEDEDERMDVEEDAYMPRPSLRQVRTTGRGVALSEPQRDKASLFSSLSPNTFSGRNLGSATAEFAGPSHNMRGGSSSSSPRPHRTGKPSALKSATAAELTSSAQRRKQKRTVSFAVESAASSSPQSGRRAASVKSHTDPLRRVPQ